MAAKKTKLPEDHQETINRLAQALAPVQARLHLHAEMLSRIIQLLSEKKASDEPSLYKLPAEEFLSGLRTAWRERIFASCNAGDGVGEIVEALCVSASYVSKMLSRWRKTGERSARPQRCHLPPKLLGLHDAIRAQVLACPDATLAEPGHWLNQTHQASASDALMHGTLVRLGLTHKKRPCMPPSRSGRMWPRHAPNGASSSQA